MNFRTEGLWIHSGKSVFVLIKTIKHIFLGITLLLLAVTLGYFLLFEREAPIAVDQYYLQSVQDRVTERIQVAKAELAPLEISLPETNGEISRVNLPETTHPYYIYENGNIVYWSDNYFVPEFVQIKDVDQVGMLTEGGYEFIVIHHSMSAQNVTCVSLIPICRTGYEGVKFNDRIFSVSPEKLSNSAGVKGFEAINDTDGKALFYIKAPKIQRILQPSLSDNTLKLLGITLLFMGIFSVLQIGVYIKEHHFGTAFLLLSIFLLLIRWLLLVNNVPLIHFHSAVFDPLPIIGNRWAVSLGDRLINSVVLLLLAGFLAVYFYRSTAYYHILKSTRFIRSLFAVSSIVVTFAISYLITSELNNILIFSGGEYAYGILTDIDQVKIVIFLYYLSLSVLFFLATHCCIYLFTKLLPNKIQGLFHWLYGSILSLILLSIVAGFNWLYLLTGVYLLIVYYYQLSRNFYVFRFKTSLYFFLAAFTFAVISTIALKNYLQYEKGTTVQEISSSIFSTANAPFENTVIKKIRAIESDQGIRADMQRQILARERVVEQIKSNYFDDFANGYQSNVYVFDSSGENMDILPESASMSSWEQKFINDAEPVANEHTLYKFAKSNGAFDYLARATINNEVGELLGSILIEFVPNGFLGSINQSPENIINPKAADWGEYSFAIYLANGTLAESNGSFSYPQSLTEMKKGLANEGFQHYEFIDNSSDNRLLIVSLPDKGWLADWGNLSFLFLISVFAISGVLIIYSFYYVYKKRSQMNFTTRIQLSLNTAFLLPLLLVLIIAISVVGTTLRLNQESGFRENTSSLASTVQLLATDLSAGRMTEAYFQQEILNLAVNSETNLTIYNAEGKQAFSNENTTSSLPNYLNPVAFLRLIDQNERQVLLNEGTFGESHLVSYVAIKPVTSSEKIIIGVPHTGAKRTLEKQLQTVISSILNIFILLFVTLLLASFFVSRQLTNPIRTVTSHLRKTNLDKLDEPLPLAETNDEMGVLVRAYNRMLKKLEESKMALSNSEKQTAWREMAKQVAHEIKNPLTPMKLSIQQLQRTLPSDDPKSKQRIERALNSLNEQIDNISEIANSFSEFAKMPVPRSEEFDLVEIIQKTADLYMTNKVSDIQLSFVQPKLMVRGDRQLMSRVLTNLIINGLQSVPLDRRPKIDISAYKNEEDSFAIIEVKDNGAGVPDDIREKVFIPNFSTKVGGSGLGLALAKRGIEHGGGNIWFETEANIGTTFYVDLPLAY